MAQPARCGAYADCSGDYIDVVERIDSNSRRPLRFGKQHYDRAFRIWLNGLFKCHCPGPRQGIFQRLRVAPIPSWAIMASRLLVQVAMIIIITTVVFIIGKNYDGITLTPAAYVITYFTAIIGGSVSLSLGQTVVGFIKNPETVNSTTRLVYITFIIVGMLGEVYMALNKLDKMFAYAVQYSPYGTVKTILSTGMEPAKWNSDTTTALLVTIAYTIVFTILGIKWFKWNTK